MVGKILGYNTFTQKYQVYAYIHASLRKVYIHVSAYAYACNTKSTSAHASTHRCTPANSTHAYAYAHVLYPKIFPPLFHRRHNPRVSRGFKLAQE